MNDPIETETTPHAVAMSIAGLLSQFGNGELADLRRLDDEVAAPAYWRLAARHEVLAARPAVWAPIVRALAILTPKGPPGERPGLHDGKRKFGTVLCDGGVAGWPGPIASGQSARPAVSERRLAQLLAARGSQRSVLLMRAVHAIAARREPAQGIDVGDLAWTFLRTEEVGAIAGPYYHRLDRARRSTEETEETLPDD